MQEIYNEFQRLGCEIVAVSFAPPDKVATYLEKYPLPFLAVADPERNAYRAFSLAKTTWWDFFRPRVLLRYLKLMFRGWAPQKAVQNDLLQLGGDFVLDEKRRLVFAYRSTEPTDRPSAQSLLEFVRRINTQDNY